MTPLPCGAGCAGAHDAVIELAGKLNAPIVQGHAARRVMALVEYDNPFDRRCGATGLISASFSGYAAMKACDTLLILGADFPYRQFYPESAKVAQVDLRAESLGNRRALDLGVLGDVGATIALLLMAAAAEPEEQRRARARGEQKKKWRAAAA